MPVLEDAACAQRVPLAATEDARLQVAVGIGLDGDDGGCELLQPIVRQRLGESERRDDGMPHGEALMRAGGAARGGLPEVDELRSRRLALVDPVEYQVTEHVDDGGLGEGVRAGEQPSFEARSSDEVGAVAEQHESKYRTTSDHCPAVAVLLAFVLLAWSGVSLSRGSIVGCPPGAAYAPAPKP